MSEVSCRAFRFFEEAAASGVCDLGSLTEGCGAPLSVLQDPRARVSWDVWALLCERFGALFPSDAALRDTARFAVNDSFAGGLTRIAALLVDARLLYGTATRWVGPNLYHSVRFEVQERDDRSLVVTARLLPGYAPSRAWFVMFSGAMEVVPLFVGHPRASVEVLELDGTSARVLVRTAPAPRPSKLLRAFQAVRTPAVLAEELAAQQEELNRAWSDMRRTMESFRNALDAMPELVAIHEDGLVRYANPALAKVLGLQPRELEGRRLAELVAPEDRSAAAALVRDGGASKPVTLRLSRADGEPCWVEARAAGAVQFDGARARLLLGTDLRAERRVREELVRTEATISALLEHLPDLVLRLSDRMVLLDAQAGHSIPERDALRTMVGVDVASLLEAFPYADTSEARAQMARYRADISAGRVFEWEGTLPESGGRPRSIRVRGVPLLGGTESLLFVSDHTEAKETERRLLIAERMASLGTLAAGIAHEINNPLTYVTMNLELLREAIHDLGPAAQSALGRLVEDAADGAARIRATLETTRDISRVEPTRVERVSPARVAERAVAMTGHALRHRARLVTGLDSSELVLADETSLVEVFVNLIVNAAQALPDDASRENEVRVQVEDDGDHVRIVVRDNGVGIAAEDLPHVFEPFFTTKDDGTGLGLSITHRIVRSLGGTIEVDSQPGVGSTFTVTLPVAPRASDVVVVPPRVPSVPPPADLRSVLVIDDDPVVARGVARALAAHHVTILHSGADAVQHLGEHGAPDVLLCDLMMPGMSGMDVYDWILRERPELAPRVVFLTGGAFTERAERFLEDPGIRVTRKPVAVDELRRLVEDVGRRRGA